MALKEARTTNKTRNLELETKHREVDNMEGEQVQIAARREDNTVFVGRKNTMGYVLAVVTQFNNGASEVNIKARGNLISRAVDVVEIIRNRFMTTAKLKSIDIKTEVMTSEDGSKSNVSAIEITLQK